MCGDPNTLVWPTVAVALPGRFTSPSSFIVISACQPWRSILVTVPTLTSPTRTREFCSTVVTSGSCAWTSKAPGPCPFGARNRSEFHAPPSASRHDGPNQCGYRQRSSGTQPGLGHGWPPVGSIKPGNPCVGSVAAATAAPGSAGGGAPGGSVVAGGAVSGPGGAGGGTKSGRIQFSL